MVSEKIGLPTAPGQAELPTSTAKPLPFPAKTTSLDQIVKRHQHVQRILQHPSQEPVPAESRIVATAVAKRIVVVDDESDQVELTVMFLEAAGHTAYGTTDGRLALDLIVLHEADLLLVDFMMPIMSGGAVCRALQPHLTNRRTKIVMISGTPEDVVRADFDGYEAFLQKPVHPDRLLRTVEDL